MTKLLWRGLLILSLYIFSLPSFALLQLRDGQNFVYDIGEGCALMRGTLETYANMYQLRINGTVYSGKINGLSFDGREVHCDVFTEPTQGIEVERRIYVPKTQNFARFSEILYNPHPTERQVNVEIFGNLGAGANTTIVADQGHFLITDDIRTQATAVRLPTLLHYHSQVSNPVTAYHGLNGSRLGFTYPDLTLPPQTKVRLIYFVAQTENTEVAQQVATLIFNNPTALYENIAFEDHPQLLNFIPPPPTAPFNDFSVAPIINAGEQRYGVLSSEDAWSHRRTATAADAYTLPLKAGQQVTLQMSAYFNAYLYLFADAAAGILIAANDDQSPETTQAEIVFTAPEAKVYYLEATAHHRTERGDYTLKVLNTATSSQPYAYPFDMTTDQPGAPTEVVFTDFSPGDELERCWQFGDGRPLHCDTAPTVTHRFEQPGHYTVGLTVRDGQGAYAYHSEQIAIQSAPTGVVLPLSNTVMGELTTRDDRSQTHPQAFADRYRISSVAVGQAFVLEMHSDQFDSYLYLYDKFGQLLRQDNNSGGGQQARMYYTPTYHGDLFVEATSFRDNAQGSYRLSLNATHNTTVETLAIETSALPAQTLQNIFVARLPPHFQVKTVWWDFGDNSPLVFTDKAIVAHTYSQSGRFTVTATTIDVEEQLLTGTDDFVITRQPAVPIARFRASPLFGESPLQVFFSNESSFEQADLNYWWQFGDGEVSTEVNPIHTFSQEGTYQVLLRTYVSGSQQSASYSLPIFVIDRNSGALPIVATTRLRPQVLMVGFDPILIDLLDTDFKVFAVIRPGAEQIKRVNIVQNNGEFTWPMQHVATYASGDQRYEAVLTLNKGELTVATYTSLFGDQPAQFRVQAVDQGEQFHAFPNLEFGDNPVLETTQHAIDIKPSRQIGARRHRPQVLAAGFDPALVDMQDTQFSIKAIIREGLYPLQSVFLQRNQGDFKVLMQLKEVLPNGDKLFTVNYTYPSDHVKINTWGNLFGDQPTQFNVMAVDQAQQKHRFPALEIGNFPQM